MGEQGFGWSSTETLRQRKFSAFQKIEDFNIFAKHCLPGESLDCVFILKQGGAGVKGVGTTHYFPFVTRRFLLQHKYFVGPNKIVCFSQNYYSREVDICILTLEASPFLPLVIY